MIFRAWKVFLSTDLCGLAVAAKVTPYGTRRPRDLILCMYGTFASYSLVPVTEAVPNSRHDGVLCRITHDCTMFGCSPLGERSMKKWYGLGCYVVSEGIVLLSSGHGNYRLRKCNVSMRET